MSLTTLSQNSAMLLTPLSQNSAVLLTPPSLSGIIDTTQSVQTPLSQFEKLVKALISFKEKFKPKFKHGWTILPKAFETKAEKIWLPKETFLTQQCHWHRRAYFKCEYRDVFEVICKNTLGCEAVAQGKMFDEKKQRSKISWDCPFSNIRMILVADLNASLCSSGVRRLTSSWLVHFTSLTSWLVRSASLTSLSGQV